MVPVLLVITYPFWSIPVGNFLAPRGGFDQDFKKKTPQRNFNLNDIRITQYKNGRTTSVILADSARNGEDPDTLLMETVNANIFDKKDSITHIVAKKGRYNSNTEMLTLIGDVVVHKLDGDQTLFTQLLYYNNKIQTVECPGDSQVTSPKVTITGGNLHYNIETAVWIMGKPVHCVLLDYNANVGK
ncbi:LPS export ABC transporter periplasmic protein LptC [Desulforhopalus vacuolatus]|uniref:LPS export ABC transporter periplasmic protein LptC n=1 Tax=Desulforhopalus vacuolatus TaxID=40414 RepID=UPI001962CA71|nr:LPS export ABC transporter periplasmic protein LptC [Desulforhopalus vacuolatus]MBM9521104.1 LPS export ABC transporter periplasmic protein LptC [Desulforhopalus vacuolatus]